jgi:hypothetical protein
MELRTGTASPFSPGSPLSNCGGGGPGLAAHWQAGTGICLGASPGPPGPTVSSAGIIPHALRLRVGLRPGSWERPQVQVRACPN